MNLRSKKGLILLLLFIITVAVLVPILYYSPQFQSYEARGNYVAVIRVGGSVFDDALKTKLLSRPLSADIDSFGSYRLSKIVDAGRELSFYFMFQVAAGYNLVYSSSKELPEEGPMEELIRSPHKILFNLIIKRINVFGNDTILQAYYLKDTNVYITEQNKSEAILLLTEYSFYYDPRKDGFTVPYVEVRNKTGYVNEAFMNFNTNNTFVVEFSATWNISFWQGASPDNETSFFTGSDVIGKITVTKLSYYKFNITLEFHDYYQGPIPVYLRKNIIEYAVLVGLPVYITIVVLFILIIKIREK